MDDEKEIEDAEFIEIIREQNDMQSQAMKWQFAIIVLLAILLASTNIYNSYLWANRETIVVESNAGGSANYINGKSAGEDIKEDTTNQSE